MNRVRYMCKNCEKERSFKEHYMITDRHMKVSCKYCKWVWWANVNEVKQ